MEQVQIVLLTVGKAVLLVEVTLLQWNTTVGTLETVWMPHLVEGVDCFLQPREGEEYSRIIFEIRAFFGELTSLIGRWQTQHLGEKSRW